jgi:Sulfotransferase domain
LKQKNGKGKLSLIKGGACFRSIITVGGQYVKNLFAFFISKAIAVLNVLERVLRHLVKHLERIKLIHKDFTPRPSDIFIVTYPRSGTTWMQMILYQLTTDGAMDFNHISQKSPFFEVDFCTMGDFNQFPSPRILKTHLSSRWFPRQWPCRYICVIRDGRDVAVSSFNFRQSHFGFKENFFVFFEQHFIKSRHPEMGSWFQHTSGWLDRRKDHNILYLSYEDLKTDLQGGLYRIADFCGIEIDPARLPEILHRCSFAFMKQYEDQFDPAGTTGAQPVRSGAFIRKGKSGGWSEYFGPEQQEMFDRQFWKSLGKKFNSVENLSISQRPTVKAGKS